MGTAAGMISAAEKSIGLSGRPNYITRDYAKRHGSEFLEASWCDMAITYWARNSGNAGVVLPAGDRAYTPWHADDFRKIGRWFAGTTTNVNRIEPGDIVFFDWGNSNDPDKVDHVGVAVRALGGGAIETIEGNTADSVKRRIRYAADIAGYGRPNYSPPPARQWNIEYKGNVYTVPYATPFLEEGSTGKRVGWMQRALNALGAKLKVDEDFGPATKAALIAFQKKYKDENGAKLEADGVYGHHSARALFMALGGKKEDAT